MGRNDGLTQALIVSVTGLVMLIVDLFALGPVVDFWVYLASTLEIYHPVFREMMYQFMVFGQWFYYIIIILGCLFVLYSPIYIIKRHRYMDIEPANDERTFGG